MAGYIVGRAGVGRKLSAGAFIVGVTVLMILLIQRMVSSGCPSCVDAVIPAPFVIAILLIPFLVGQRLGGRARRRAADL